MSYCPYCGREVSADMSFCPGCGASLNSEIRTYTLTGSTGLSTGNYKVYIASLGSADKYDMADLLEDVLGYTGTAATNLLNNIPVQIAANLSLKQAAVVAQAFEEYGAELVVTNGEEVTDITPQTSAASLFNTDGSFLASAAVVLATLGAANRLRTINKPKKASLLERIFHSLFGVKKKPPVHVRRNIRPRNIRFQPDEPPMSRKTIRQQLKPVERNELNERRPQNMSPGKPGDPHGRGGRGR